MKDILFKTEDYVFSYRVAGICVENGRVLLQTTTVNDDGYAFPGGHVSFGETNAETLKREFQEEIGAEIEVGELAWVGEVFFPWGDKPCHQICLYYNAKILSDSIPREGQFGAIDELDGKKANLIFKWIPITELKNYPVYPPETVEYLTTNGQPTTVMHFIYKEQV